MIETEFSTIGDVRICVNAVEHVYPHVHIWHMYQSEKQ